MKYFLLLLLLLPAFAFSQTLVDSIPFDSSNYARYEGIIEQPGSQDELYNKGKIWLAEAFKDAKAVVRTADKEAGTIVGKGIVQYSFMYATVKKNKLSGMPVDGSANFTIKLFFKEGKYKYVISDISYNDNYMAALGDRNVYKAYVEIAAKNNSLANLNQFREINNSILLVIDDLKKKMAAKADNSF